MSMGVLYFLRVKKVTQSLLLPYLKSRINIQILYLDKFIPLFKYSRINMKRFEEKMSIVLRFLFLITFLSCSTAKTQPVAINGIIDLRDWSFQKDGILRLNGQWNLFWEEILSPSQVLERINSNEKIYTLAVPGAWNNQDWKGLKLPGHGYATLHLRLINVPQEKLGVYVNIIGTSFRLFCDNNIIYEN